MVMGILNGRTTPFLPKIGFSFADDGGAGGGGADDDKGGGGTATSWRDGISEEYRNDPSMNNFKSVDDLAKGYLNAQKLVGKDKLVLPASDAGKEDWDRVFNTLGRPEKPEDYKVEDIQIENLPKDFPVDNEMKAGFAKKAHELGLLPGQVNELYKWYMTENMNLYNTGLQANAEAVKNAETKLRQKYGAAFEQKVNLARKVFDTFGDDETRALMDSGFGNDPRVIGLFASIGEKMSEDVLGPGKSGPTLSPAEAQAEIDKIMGNRQHPYWIKGHPENASSIRRVNQLYEMVEAGKQ